MRPAPAIVGQGPSEPRRARPPLTATELQGLIGDRVVNEAALEARRMLLLGTTFVAIYHAPGSVSATTHTNSAEEARKKGQVYDPPLFHCPP